MSNNDIDLEHLQRFLGYRLTRTQVNVHRLFIRTMAPLDLSPSEYAIISLIQANPGIYQRQLSEALDISAPNLVPLIERLVKRGSITRTPSAQDRRMQELSLTKSGQELHAQADAEVQRFETALEASLTATEQKYLRSAMNKLSQVKSL